MPIAEQHLAAAKAGLEGAVPVGAMRRLLNQTSVRRITQLYVTLRAD
jgi:hypothetical protein